MQNRASDTQIVGSAAGRSGNDESVAEIRVQHRGVDGSVHGKHRRGGILQYRHLIESVAVGKRHAGIGVDLQQRTALDAEIAVGKPGDKRRHISHRHIREISQMPGVDSENRRLTAAHPCRRAQKRAVAADAHHHICRHLSVAHHLVGSDVGNQPLDILQEAAFHFNERPGSTQRLKKRAYLLHLVILALVAVDCYFHIIYIFCLSYIRN